jgi:predicted nucleic acid-binding protein
MYLAWLKDEQSHGKNHIQAMAQLAKDNFELKNTIITSAITLIEVLSAKLTAAQEEQFQKTFRSPNHILYDVDPPIALKARQFRERFLNHPSGKGISTPDAVHLATASIFSVNEFHTFDDGQKDRKTLGLLELSGDERIDKLVICKPVVPQTELGLTTTVPDDLLSRRIELEL